MRGVSIKHRGVEYQASVDVVNTWAIKTRCPAHQDLVPKSSKHSVMSRGEYLGDGSFRTRTSLDLECLSNIGKKYWELPGSGEEVRFHFSPKSYPTRKETVLSH